MCTKAITHLLARAGIDPKSGMAGIGRDMRHAVQALLIRAQQAGAVRPDLRMPELTAILTAACMAAEHSQWNTTLRTRTLAVVFDDMRPQRTPPDRGARRRPVAKPGPQGSGGDRPGCCLREFCDLGCRADRAKARLMEIRVRRAFPSRRARRSRAGHSL